MGVIPKPSCCEITLQEKFRHGLAFLLVGSHAFMAFMSAGLMIGVICIKIYVERTLRVLDAEYGVLFSSYVITVCILMVLVHAAGCKLSWECKKWKTRKAVAPYLGFFLIVWSILSLLLLPGIILSAIETSRVHKSVENGFEKAMHAYTNGTVSKVQKQTEFSKVVDTLQVNYRCCGYKNYTDWFNVPWINTIGFDMKDPHIKRLDLVVQLYLPSTVFTIDNPGLYVNSGEFKLTLHVLDK